MLKAKSISLLVSLTVVSLFVSGCGLISYQEWDYRATMQAMQGQINELAGATPTPSGQSTDDLVNLGPADVSFTLRTGVDGQNLVFIGVGGDIDGLTNPTIQIETGNIVEITLINGMAAQHDIMIDEFGVATGLLFDEGAEAKIKFTADQNGSFYYYCAVPGHRLAGMEGIMIVGKPAEIADAISVVKNPSDLPGQIAGRGPELIQVELVGKEVTALLDDGTTYDYFTFNGTVPGPFIRASVGDRIEITLRNETDSSFVHSVDLHAVNGPGGGAEYTQTQPGETTVFNFQALAPGIYVYHCATPSVAHHIANGMYGLILIEPEGGLPVVDREFYVVQGEIYTEQAYGTVGHLTFSHEKMLDETPEWFVFNGAAGALTSEENALYANVGETIRLFIGVGGPNYSSSFHVIGEIFDKVYPFGSLTSEPITNVQTINVNPGAAWAVEFEVEVPGTYLLVDHALSRVERGLVGYLHVAGEENPAVISKGPVLP